MVTLDHRWFEVTTTDGKRRATFQISADAVQAKGLRLTFDPKGMHETLEHFDALPLTPYLIDQRFLQADVRNDPAPKYYPGGVGMDTPQAELDHSNRVGCHGLKSVGNTGKHWYWPLTHEELYGWNLRTDATSWRGIKLHNAITKGLKVIQPASGAHSGPDDNLIDGYHRDYSMTCVGVHKLCRVDGKLNVTETLFRAHDPLVWGSSASLPIRTRLGDRGQAVLLGQQFLLAAGLDPGPIDGIHGKRTEAAWQTFERSQTGFELPIADDDIVFKQARYYKQGRPYGSILWFVMHTAEMFEHDNSAEALQNYAFNMEEKRKASWHYAGDSDSITQSVRDSDRANAAGPGNDRGLHFELAGWARQTAAEWHDDYSRNQLRRMARLWKRKAKKHNVPIVKLTPHEVLNLNAGFCGHRDISEACKLAREQGRKVSPWWNPATGKWRTTTHSDPGPNFPWDEFVEAVKAA